MSMATDLGDAIVADLNGASFSQSFTAARRWLARWKVEELATLHVTVLPASALYETLSRSQDEEQHEIDIAIQKHIEVADNAQIDAMIALMEELVAHYRAKTLAIGAHQFQCLRRRFLPGAEVGYLREHLDELHVFTGVLRTSWFATTL